MSRTPDHLPDDLAGVGEALESHRPRPTAMELDRVKRRAMASATGSSHRYPKDSFMRSRLAVASMLVAGFTMSGAGAALGTSALSAQNDSASAAQYGTPPQQGTPPVTPPQPGTPPVTPPQPGTPPVTPPQQPTNIPNPQLLGEVTSSGEDAPPPSDDTDDTLGESTGGGEGTPLSDTLGESASGEGPTTAAVQEPRQLSAGDGGVGAQSAQLPFTGYASVPLLIVGLGLLVSGFVLRRSTARGAPQG